MSKSVKTVVVIGMHRSGTSMIARVLTKLGVVMGQELVGANWSNPLGHFEDEDFFELNNRILKEASGSWDNPPKQEMIWDQKDKFAEEIKALIEKKNSKGCWGWKDPRTSLSIELYLPYLTNPYFIVCHRDPKAISLSLRRRNQINLRAGRKITSTYKEQINGFFNRHPNLRVLHLSYEFAIKNPEELVKGIIDFLALEVTQDAYRQGVRSILPNEEMRHLSNRMKLAELIKKNKKKPWKTLPLIWKVWLLIMSILRYHIKIKKRGK